MRRFGPPRLAAAALGLFLGLALTWPAQATGLRNIVALPVDRGGAVLRAVVEHNNDRDSTLARVGLALGLHARHTLLLGLPWRISDGPGPRTGDVSLLYRPTVLQKDFPAGTHRVAPLLGAFIPTDKARDERLQAGAVYTWYQNRGQFDVNALWFTGTGNAPDGGRYDIAFDWRLAPAQYPEWGRPMEWHGIVELGGRYQAGNAVQHQLTVGGRLVFSRVMFEAGVIQGLNEPGDDTSLLVSSRVHF